MVLTPDVPVDGEPEVRHSSLQQTSNYVSSVDDTKEGTFIAGGPEDETVLAATNYLNADLGASTSSRAIAVNCGS